MSTVELNERLGRSVLLGLGGVIVEGRGDLFTADWYFEFTAPGIDKARALRGALPKLGIDASEVVSFGDGQNDKSMIEWAGIGVAMGNAIDEVKAVAQMVTANNNEDGIAVALDQLLG